MAHNALLNSTGQFVFHLLSFFHTSTLLAVSHPRWRLSPNSPSPLALIHGFGSWQPHPVSYRLALVQCPRSSFTDTVPTSHTPFLFLHLSPLHISSVHFFVVSFPLTFSLFVSSPRLQSFYFAAVTLDSFWQPGGDCWGWQQKPSPALFQHKVGWAGRARAHKATAELNKGCVLHHSNRGHSDSCLRHAHTDKRPEKQMVCAFMTSLVEAQESPPFKGRVFVSHSIIKLFSLVEN